MRAIICSRYGPPEVLQLTAVVKPIPADNEVLVKVHAATVMAGDCELRGLKVSLPWQLLLRIGFGFTRPRRRILGQDVAGEVESVGKDVRKFKKGDKVYGNTLLHLGAYAEYDSLPENGMIATKPANVSYEEAAAAPAAGLYVLPLFRKAEVRSGQMVLIIGAGGTMGTFAVQLAKLSGAIVTAVDSTSKLDMLKSIGADHVVDYTKEDFTKREERYDVIIDLVGKSSISGCMNSLKENGIILLGNPGLSQLIRGRLARKEKGKKVKVGRATYAVEDLRVMRELLEVGKIRSVIDRRYPLEQTAEAHRYVDTGRKAGNVVITVFNDADSFQGSDTSQA